MSAKGHLEIRTHCLLCEWQGEWVRTPLDSTQGFAAHLDEHHREVLADPTKMRTARNDEFRYVKEA